MAPSRSSDSGPLCRNPHSDDVRCSGCLHLNPRTSSVRCQGATPDLCASYLCDGCEVRCWGCNLPVCEDHRVTIDGHVSCDECLRMIWAQAITEAAAILQEVA